LTRLKAATADAPEDLEELCDQVLASMTGAEVTDDIALVALRPVPLSAGPLRIRVLAEPRMLAPLRQTLRRWLREIDTDKEDANAILVACGEACANAIQHAYGAEEGYLELGLDVVDGDAEITVRDEGTWRLSIPGGPDGGRGLQLMEGFMDSVEVLRGDGGTTVRMRRRIGTRADSERVGRS
jgi:anti-sigma regulatory factor (Ser/Thr protein kinase)